jgi:hypothetical protein
VGQAASVNRDTRRTSAKRVKVEPKPPLAAEPIGGQENRYATLVVSRLSSSSGGFQH